MKRAATSLTLALLLPLGCTSVDGDCQRACDWETRCVADSVNLEDCSQQCVNDAKTRSGDCTDAFSEFASCAADNQSCAAVDQQCASEATRLIEKCDCQNPKGPVARLCR